MYKLSLKKFVKFINEKNLQLVTKIDLEKKYFNHLNSLKLKKQSKRLMFAAVISFYNYFINTQKMDTYGKENLQFIENPVLDKRIGNYKILYNKEYIQLQKYIL
ncbi:MAG: hypothetical protein ACTSRG_23545 [Candidatus Helarchaeota archaeon]